MGLDQDTCSSDDLATGAGVNSAQVRKDLSYLDPPGVRGVGYKTAALRELLRRELGLNQKYRVAIVGAGNLGRALTLYPGFAEAGFEIACLFDTSPVTVGTTINGIRVEPLSALERVARSTEATIGIIATPMEAAQQVADRLVVAGIRSILNFAPAVLKVSERVQVRRVDLSTELQILAYHQIQGMQAQLAGD